MQLFSCRRPLRRRKFWKFAFQNTKHPRNLSDCFSDSGSLVLSTTKGLFYSKNNL